MSHHSSIAFFSVTTLFLGRQNTRVSSLGPTEKPNTVGWLMPLPKHVGFPNFLRGLDCPPSKATAVYCDNISAVYMSSNPVQDQRTKHIEIDIHFVRVQVALGLVLVLHVPSSSQYADIFTKAQPTSLFNEV